MELSYDLEYYDMSKNKILLIFNNRDFPEESNLLPLPSNDVDQQRLARVFTAFGFRVEPYLNLEVDQILDVIAKFNNEVDHSQTSCVCVAVTTHGDDGGTLYAADRSYNLNELVEALQDGPDGLLGKPKLFLVDACRGGCRDPGRRAELDGPGGAAVSSHADTLVFNACVEGFTALAERGGSLMLQELCGVMERRHRDLHLLDMATLTTSRVARGRVALVKDEKTQRRVNALETPEIRSTLTKLLRFTLAQR